MNIFQKIIPRDSITFLLFLSVLAFAGCLYLFRNKSSKTKWIVRLIFFVIFLVLVSCKWLYLK